MDLVNLLFSHLIVVIIIFVFLLIILVFSSLESYLLTKKSILGILIFALVIEIIVGIWIALQVKPALEIQPAVYPISFKYRDYSKDWIKSSPTEKEKLCIKNYIQTRTRRRSDDLECQDFEDEYIRQERVFNKTGKGCAYLSCNTKAKNCKGLASYKFPDGSDPIILEVDIDQSIENKMTLKFKQVQTYIKINNICSLRPERKFSITAERKGNKNEFIFIGDFKHPDRKILLAEFSLSKSLSQECQQ